MNSSSAPIFAEEAMSVEQLLGTYPRVRPALSPDHARIYAEQYRLNREGARLVEGLAQRLERWMHYQVASVRGGPILELGAGTLNHSRYENDSIAYDVVEPFRALYEGRPEAARIGRFFDSVADVPNDRRYQRIISIAVLEHMENLPKDLAMAALLLDAHGVFQAGIPSEGGLLWGLAWRMSTGISYYLRTGLDYGTVMRHEHVNESPEIIVLMRHLYQDVRLRRFPLPFHHLSFYTYVEARGPRIERCRELALRTAKRP